MNAVEKTTDWYRQRVQGQDNTSCLDRIPWIQQFRQEARDSFMRTGFPDRKQEAWRYSNIQRLLKHPFVPAQPDAKADVEQVISNKTISKLDAHRLVFADNGFRADLSTIGELPDGVEVQSLAQASQTASNQLQEWLGHGADHRQNTFVALNTSFMSDGLFIHIRDNVKVAKPIEILYLTSSLDDWVASTPRVLVVLSAGSKVTLIERYVGAGPSFYFHNMVEEIFLGEHASLNHYRLLEEKDQAFHLSNIYMRQSGGSQFRSMNLDLSGAWLRTNYQIDFQGQDAKCELNGLYVVDSTQQSNMHTEVLHHVPSCHSEQNYKGLLLGTGKAVFDGRILVDKQAQSTNAHLSNSNLMLSAEAEVDTKPQLEIYADNVKCSHGTTVGQLEPEQLFYLRSRGIKQEDAYRMLCQGFASEIMQACDIEALNNYAEAKLQQSMATDPQKQV